MAATENIAISVDWGFAISGPYDGAIEASGSKVYLAVTLSDTVGPSSALVAHTLDAYEAKQINISEGEHLWLRGDEPNVFIHTPEG